MEKMEDLLFPGENLFCRKNLSRLSWPKSGRTDLWTPMTTAPFPYRQIFPMNILNRSGQKYGIVPGIGSDSHFAGDYSIGLSLGWGGLLEAHENPALHPDLVVRVTGFTAYFAALSPEFRQLVVNRFVVISPSKRPGGPVYYGSHLRKNYGPL
jgi:hypothetical protein